MYGDECDEPIDETPGVDRRDERVEDAGMPEDEISATVKATPEVLSLCSFPY